MNDSGRGTTILIASIISAFVSAVTTVCIQRALDIAFPVPQLIEQQQPTDLKIPSLAYSFSYSAYAEPEPPRLLGLIRYTPIYYYEVSLGNSSDGDSGIISITIDFPEEFKSAAVFLTDRTIEYRAKRSIHFQTTELKSNFGKSFKIGIKAEDLPDITRMKVQVTSKAGEFTTVSKNLYDKVFVSKK